MKISHITNENAEDLNIGDPVIITGKVQFQGKTGDIVDFGKDKRFVIVNLYNYGKHSFNSSDVGYNDYVDSDQEEADAYDRDPDARNWMHRQEVGEAKVDKKTGTKFVGHLKGTDSANKVRERLVGEAKSLQSKFEKHLAKHGYDVAEKSKYWEQKIKDIDAQIAAWDAEMERRKQGKEMKSEDILDSRGKKLKGRDLANYFYRKKKADAANKEKRQAQDDSDAWHEKQQTRGTGRGHYHEGMNEGFGSQYSEELAQAVYANNPDLDTTGTADELVGAGFEIAADELGRKKARNLFAYDEDFASDFVSAYSWLKQGGSQHVGEGDELNVGIEAYGVRGTNSKKWRKKFKSQEAFEKWLDANEGDVEVLGTREVNLNDMFEQGVAEGRKPEKDDREPEPSQGDIGITKGDARDAAYDEGFRHAAGNKHGSNAKEWGPYAKYYNAGFMAGRNDTDKWYKRMDKITRTSEGVAEEYDPSYDPEYRGHQRREQDPDAWKQDRDLEEPAKPTNVTVRDAEGNVVLQFPSTGGYYGDVRYAKGKGFDTEADDYQMNWQKNEDSMMAEDSGVTSEQVASEIVRRIIFKHKDAISAFGPEAIMAAAREVGEYFAGWDELGTSDISIATKYTLEKLDQMSRGALGESATGGATSVGAIATTPAGGAGKKVGSLFGGTYKQKRTKKSPGTK